MFSSDSNEKQGRIHGNPVADGWAGAVMRKPLAIQKYFGRTDRRTDGRTDTARCRVACPRLKSFEFEPVKFSILFLFIFFSPSRMRSILDILSRDMKKTVIVSEL